MIRSIFFIIFAMLICWEAQGQTAHKLLRSGDKLYDNQDFQSAEETYRKAIEDKLSANGEYNLGNSIYQQNRYEEALNHYEQAASLSGDPEVKSDAYYNLGNTYMNMEEFEKGVDAYKNALRNNPNDEDSKYNLSVANRIVKQMQQQEQEQEQQQQEGQENKEQEESEEQEQQENQEQQEGEQKEQEEQNPQEGEENKDEKEQQPQEGEPQEEKKDLNKEEATRLLQVVEEDEKRTQQKLKKADSKQNKQEKDW